MDKFIKLLQLVIQIAILVLICWFLFFRSKEDHASLQRQAREYWENPKFVGDTIISNFDYSKLPKPIYKNYVPPAIVIQYPDTVPPGVSLELRDSLLLVINKLTGTVDSLNQAYVLLYPSAPKLIYGSFTADTLKLDLLDSNGRISESVYPVNYMRFAYQFRNSKFNALELQQKRASRGLHQVAYVYGGYTPTYKAPNLGADYSIYKGKLRLQANTYLTIEQQPNFYFGVNAGWKLYGRD